MSLQGLRSFCLWGLFHASDGPVGVENKFLSTLLR